MMKVRVVRPENLKVRVIKDTNREDVVKGDILDIDSVKIFEDGTRNYMFFTTRTKFKMRANISGEYVDIVED